MEFYCLNLDLKKILSIALLLTFFIHLEGHNLNGYTVIRTLRKLQMPGRLRCL